MAIKLFHLALLPFLFLLTSFPLPTSATPVKCPCGYRTDTGHRYTHRLYNDFSLFPDTTSDDNLISSLPEWYLMSWRTPGDPNLHTIARQNERGNIWIKDGVLCLRQRGYKAALEGGMSAVDAPAVSVAEMNTREDDVLYGSFRMIYKVDHVVGAKGGSIAGFFAYYNDTQESDIEIVTKDDNSVLRYTNHPAYDPETDTVTPGASYRAQFSRPLNEFQEQRFDWLPNGTNFYQSGKFEQAIAMNVPSHPAKIMINLWANNGSWSGPPSTEDVIMAIKEVKLYYNTTKSHAGLDEDFNKKCERAGSFENEEAICSAGEPEPKGVPNGAERIDWGWGMMLLVCLCII